MDIVEIYHLKKYFWEGVRQIKALDGIDLAIEKGRLTAITGASGSGKTTLLNTIGGLYRPTQGEVWVDGINLGELSEEQLTVFRRRKVGFVFQDYNLIPELTVRENILFPLALDGLRTDEVFFREIVGLLGLEPRLGAYSYELSGGERQCAAIARALITRPSIILADEPTGSLDVRSGQNVAGVLKMAVEVFRQTVVMVTHNLEAAQVAERVVGMKDGRVDD
ncbi:MAG: ABC transporter ATP-binding protein [Lachnospiraceae bacterium]|nr:ABC transporter ATP-binding protein [Lachnospiraceae bacterium]MCI9623291.1 ABC transporter ATP-binding protein [Lachnospiraceae bacterium]GFI09664.1 bacitracin export ATP-binding protein BceA [Lachnospiraceae bacterium]